MAEWDKVFAAGSNSFDVYLNPDTIRKSSNNVKMWVLYDNKWARGNAGKKYMSTKLQNEYNCKEERIRTIYQIHYSENMGSGEVVFTFKKPNEWTPITPDSVDEGVWKIACGK